MTRNVKWIVGALAAALWAAPAAADTGSTSQHQERPYTTGNGTDPTRSNTDSDRAPASQANPGGTGSGSDTSGMSGTRGSATGNGTDPTRSNSDNDRAPVSGSATTSDREATSGSSAPDTGAATAGASAADTSQTVAKLHAGNEAEIRAGQYMEQHAQSSKVKDFAKKMVKDHRSLDKDLMAFAKKKQIDLSGGSSAASSETEQARQQLSQLEGTSGAQADQHYMTMMVRDHERDVSAVHTAAQQAKSSNEKDFAKLLDKTAKKMEGHLKDAQKIQRDLTQRQARNPAR